MRDQRGYISQHSLTRISPQPTASNQLLDIDIRDADEAETPMRPRRCGLVEQLCTDWRWKNREGLTVCIRTALPREGEE